MKKIAISCIGAINLFAMPGQDDMLSNPESAVSAQITAQNHQPAQHTISASEQQANTLTRLQKEISSLKHQIANTQQTQAKSNLQKQLDKKLKEQENAKKGLDVSVSHISSQEGNRGNTGNTANSAVTDRGLVYRLFFACLCKGQNAQEINKVAQAVASEASEIAKSASAVNTQPKSSD